MSPPSVGNAPNVVPVAGQSCTTCRYWLNLDGTTNRCHRYPPMPGIPAWPTVAPTDWCGEWKQ